MNTFVAVDPDLVSAAAADLRGINAVIDDANAAAMLKAAGIAPAGADEVSVAITAVFNSHAQSYQEVAAQASAFNENFALTLTAGGNAYHGTEQVSLQTLWGAVTFDEQPLMPLLNQSTLWNTGSQTATPSLPSAPPGQTVVLELGGTNYPVLGGYYPSLIQQLFFPSKLTGSIYTPEQFWPLTPNLGSMSLDQSIAYGVPLLNTAIFTEINHGNPVIVWTTSQSSTVATVEIRNLMANGSPDTNMLSFVLTGDPNNPNGGLLERFNGLYLPGLDVLFNGATPPNSPYPTQIWTNQYDGVANAPQYPLNGVSDVNAFFGFLFGAHNYTPLWETQNGVQLPLSTTSPAHTVQLPTSPGYTGNTTYYFDLEQNLPLVQPLRLFLPQPWGNAFADLAQPDLRVIVDMGYGSDEYANIPTPASLLELPDPFTIFPDLLVGSIQGPQAFAHDLGAPVAMPSGYPYNPELNTNLNYPLPQHRITAISVFTMSEGWVFNQLGLVPQWS